VRISELTFGDGTVVPLRDVVVVVGGNATGKTTLLRECYGHATGRGAVFRWLRRQGIQDRDYRRSARLFLDSLEHGSIGGMATRVSTRSTPLTNALPSSGDHRDVSRLFVGNAERMAQGDASYSKILELDSNGQDRAPFFAFLTSENRLGLIKDRARVSPLSETPKDALNVLWRTPALLDDLAARVHREFGSRLLLLDHEVTELQLGVADEPVPEDLLCERMPQRRFEAVAEWARRHFTPLGLAGDGIRAAIALFVGLLEPIHQVLLIDEPELHLYPSKRASLGRELADLAKRGEKQIVVTTHDPSFVQGLLEAARSATILRLGVEAGRRRVWPTQFELEPHHAVVARTEQLGVIFNRGAVIVEGVSDRAFYQGVMEIFRLGSADEIGFARGDGKSGTLNAVALCQELSVPWALILDFDAILEPGSLKKLAQVRGRSLDVRRIAEATGKATSESTEGPEGLKHRGLSAPGLADSTREALKSMLDYLRELGIHIVETGQLESWVPEARGDKLRFPEVALPMIEENRALGERARGFLARVISSLAR